MSYCQYTTFSVSCIIKHVFHLSSSKGSVMNLALHRAHDHFSVNICHRLQKDCYLHELPSNWYFCAWRVLFTISFTFSFDKYLKSSLDYSDKWYAASSAYVALYIKKWFLKEILHLKEKKSLKYLDVWVDKEWINVDQP